MILGPERNFSHEAICKPLYLNKNFSGTEHSGIDDLILDVSQASYTNGEYVDAKEWFNIDTLMAGGPVVDKSIGSDIKYSWYWGYRILYRNNVSRKFIKP